MKMLNGRQVSAKTIRMNLKNSWCLEDFIKRYELVSEEEFWKLIKDLFHGDISEVKRQLKKNEKESCKYQKSNKEPFYEVQEKIQSEESEYEEAIKTEVIENLQESFKVEVAEKVKAQEKLKDLIESEQKRAEEERQKIIALEISHEELISRKRAIQTKELPALKQVLEGYKQKIQEAQNQVINLNDELNELVLKVDNVNATLGEKRVELKNLEDEISALKIVNIFVYSSGEIEISASTEVKIPEDNEIDWVSIVTNNSEQCKTLTIAQIQSVAKILYIVKELKSWQTAFENEDCQKLFDSLVAMQSK